MKDVTFERAALYEEVWSTPLTTLAKKYAMSDNGIRKVCKAMNIPLPVHGHWAKVAAGHKVAKAPLPANAERTSFTSRRVDPARPTHRTAEDDTWLAERIAFEGRAENRIVVELAPARWHPVMTELRDQVREAVKAIPRMQRDSERQKKNPNVIREPDFSGWRYPRFMDDGQLVHDSPLKVSPLGYERALAIFNAICVEAARRELAVAMDKKEARLVLEGFEGRVEMRISERLDEAWRKEVRWDKKLENVKYKVPTGKLRLFLGATYSERQMSDGETPLEAQLNDLFVRVWDHVVKSRVQRREREARHRQWEEDERRRQAAEERRRQEAARRAKLLEDASAWQKANLLRQYVEHAKASGDERFDSEWLDWALGVADAMDPLR